MSKKQELINRIKAATPEEIEKLFTHPEFIKLIKEIEEKQNRAATH